MDVKLADCFIESVAAANMAQQLPDLTETESERFREVEEKQNNFHNWLRSKNLAPEATRAFGCRTQGDFVQFWSEISGNAQSRYNADHKKGWRLWSKRYQNFSGGVTAFMKDIEPVLDMVKAFGAPYTGLAVGTLTGLFVFAGRKNSMEGRISSALEGVKDRLPGFQMYEYIYKADNDLEKDLRKKILLAYLEFIDLSIEITRYYLRPGIYRWMIASFQSNKFNDMTETVFDRVMAIRLRCEELLNRNIAAIKQQNEELQRDNNTSHLIEIRTLLGLTSWTAEAHQEALKEYKLRLNRERAEETNYEQLSLGSKLRCDPVIAEWETSGQSRLLLLVGVNNENIAQGKRYNWVSGFALELADSFASVPTSAAPVAVHVFDPIDRLHPQSIHTALPIVLLQLLRHRQRELGVKFAEHREAIMAAVYKFSALETSENEDDEDEDKVNALKDLAVKVVSLYERTATVYIVMDRVDICRDQDHYELIRTLATIMQQAQCVVKVLLVADALGWEVTIKSLGLANTSQLSVKELRQGMLYDEGY